MADIVKISESLTKREVQILKHIYFSPLEIGTRLNISFRTVKTYLARIREKLGCSKRHEIVIIALKRGIISLNDFITE